ncbi:MAG: hypothetical protein N0E44_15720 [Candidatus Thiodiazotropha lotti]|nr:hypothetical protein [Candidatus Thiodiazotropha lotti]MCW4221332.1 hypothetical protein [Candidatus Thiodiazotropha lotti]
MPVHWTYTDFDNSSDLEQGDILFPTKELSGLFEEVHPHFCDSKYLAFLVTTQTCDLVRRKNRAKANYISIATVRPLSQVSLKLISNTVTPVAPGRFPKSEKLKAKQLFERIFNQNEQSLGLFYLHEDADLSIGEGAVALLRVTIAVKAEHYDRLLEARVGRLQPAFQAKLGWLLGNLYNRPATPDWADHDGGGEVVERLIKAYLNPSSDSGDSSVAWLDDVLIEHAKEQGVAVDGTAITELETLRPPPAIEKALQAIENELATVYPEISADKVTKLKNRLKNNGVFRKLMRAADRFCK